MKKLGFTLIELLAVIVILAIIALIAAPMILNIINSTRKEAFKNSVLSVFKSSELYEAGNEFEKISSEGIKITDQSLPFSNGSFTSGKIIRNNNDELEIVNVSNGTYCAKGTKKDLVIIKGSCDDFDDTAPKDTEIIISSVTSNSIKLIVNSIDDESGIKNYSYSIDGINFITTTSNNYTFNNLNMNKKYMVYVRVTNNNGITTETIIEEVNTKELNEPTYSVDRSGWQASKIVTINYPERENGFIYEYSLNDGATWTIVSSGTTTNVTFISNGNIIARIYDGTKYKIASSYTVSEIDTTDPILILNGNSTINLEKGSTYTELGATATDSESGINGSVVITGNVNLNTVGTYKITYTATDNAGNVTEITRNVNVLNTDYIVSKGVNKPKLATGMTPIKWNGITWVDTTEADTAWYNYNTTDKQWANAKTADGSMWVWIPRYVYSISSGWHSSTTGKIDVQFSIDTDDTRNGTVTLDTGTTANSSYNKWTNHPAFTFGTTELTGIWVAKFEPTASEGLANTNVGDNVTTKTVKILPNVQSWRYINIGNAYQVSRNMETNSVYGWGISGTNLDTHLMKNTEWGAVAYLSKSEYGKDTEEIWTNPSNNYTTGCAGDSVSSAPTTGCLKTYETANGVKASSTGTIYGIYDLSGGAFERVSAYVDNTHANLANYGSQIMSADGKYKDIYIKGSIDDRPLNYLANKKKGDAVYETSSTGENTTSWFADSTYMPYTNSPWFERGGKYGYSFAGAFNFSYADGGPSVYSSFRPVVLVGTGL